MDAVSLRQRLLLGLVAQRLHTDKDDLIAFFEREAQASPFERISLEQYLESLLRARSRPSSADRWQLDEFQTPTSGRACHSRQQQAAPAAPRLASKVVIPSPRPPAQQLDMLSDIGDEESSSPVKVYGEATAAQPQTYFNTTYEPGVAVLTSAANTAFGGFRFSNTSSSQLHSQPQGTSGQHTAAAAAPGVPSDSGPQQQPVGDNAAATRVQQQASSTAHIAQAAAQAPTVEEIRLYQESETYKQALHGCQEQLHNCEQQLQAAKHREEDSVVAVARQVGELHSHIHELKQQVQDLMRQQALAVSC